MRLASGGPVERVQDQPAARAQDAARLGDRAGHVGDVLEELAGADHVGAAGRERQLDDVGLDGVDAVRPGLLERGADLVDADVPVALAGHVRGHQPAAAAEVDQDRPVAVGRRDQTGTGARQPVQKRKGTARAPPVSGQLIKHGLSLTRNPVCGHTCPMVRAGVRGSVSKWLAGRRRSSFRPPPGDTPVTAGYNPGIRPRPARPQTTPEPRLAPTPTLIQTLVRASHPEPAVAVTLVCALLAIGAGRSAVGVVATAATVLASQLAIGWVNDAIDAPRDALVGRRDKPVATGHALPPYRRDPGRRRGRRRRPARFSFRGTGRAGRDPGGDRRAALRLAAQVDGSVGAAVYRGVRLPALLRGARSREDPAVLADRGRGAARRGRSLRQYASGPGRRRADRGARVAASPRSARLAAGRGRVCCWLPPRC